MAGDDDAPEYPDEPSRPARLRWGAAEREQAEARVGQSRRNQEITSLLAAIRAADFDLGDANHDDERLLTAMFADWRRRYERRQRRWVIAGKAGKWVVMAFGGVAASRYVPDVLDWLKSRYWP